MNRYTTTKKIAGLGLLVLLMANCTSTEVRQTKLSENEARIDSIVAQLTLEEKVNMLHGKNMFSSAGVERLGIADLEYADGPFGVREELEAHSWRALGWVTDSATFFPTGSALAATWSEDLAYEYGTGLAREVRMRGKDMILGPAINLQRIPTGGRTYEYFSEDPFLNARLAVGYTLGVQDHGVAACLKHFAVNNQENNRGQVDAIVSPRALHELYLPAFEAAVTEADAYGVMSAYNKVNGWWCSENDYLLNQTLRGAWGFKGIVISDWGGTHHTVEAALYGLDVEMPNADYMGQALLDSVQAGKVPESVIDEKVKNILRVRLAIQPVPPSEANQTVTAQPEQAEIAYRVAAASIVLLKNEAQLLPVDTSRFHKIAIIGDNAMRKQANGGVGAGVKARNEITPWQGLQDRLGEGVEMVYAQGYPFTRRGQRPQQVQSAALRQEAVEVAQTADLVIFIGGTNRETETEGSDRTSITLPAYQDSLIQALAAVNPNLIAVMVAGAPVDLRTVEAHVSALLLSWFNGSEGGHALADVLLGTVVPSGKLPFTFPLKLEDSPAYALGNYPQTDAPVSKDIFVQLVGEEKSASVPQETVNRDMAMYSEDLLVGYRWFDTKQKPVMYPFGYGLSYTEFGYENLQVALQKSVVQHSAAQNASSKPSEAFFIETSFELVNTGKVDATEVVQLYVHRAESEMVWPEKELKAFQRVTLKAGEKQTVMLQVPVNKLRYWDDVKQSWRLERGPLDIWVGTSSADIRLKGSVNL